jgi:N-methylhydantoinase A
MGEQGADDVTAAQLGLSLHELLAQTAIFTYGTTFSTNAIITRDTARTAFLTTAGHPDTLVLREGGKHNPFDFRGQYPEPYVPRRLTFEVTERIDSEGEIVVPLDEAQVAGIAAGLRRFVSCGRSAIPRMSCAWVRFWRLSCLACQ